MNHSLWMHPWARGRVALADFLSEKDFSQQAPLPDEPLQDDLRALTLHQLAVRGDLFRQAVIPVVASIDSTTDVASLVVDLLQAYAAQPSLAGATRLYHVFLSERVDLRETAQRLSEHLRAEGLDEEERIRDLLVEWVSHAPDRQPINTALFVLGQHRGTPPSLDRLLVWGKHWRFAQSAAITVLQRYPPDVAEDAVIGFAKQQRYATRTGLLELLTVVHKREHRDWLLTEGYDNGADYEQSAYAAAVLGRLIERLRAPVVDPTALTHHARTLHIMAFAVAGVGTLFEYKDGPEAIARLLGHLEALDLAASDPLLDEAIGILSFLEYLWEPQEGHEREIWTEEVVADLAARLRALLENAGVDPARFWWRRNRPTLADVKAGDLLGFNEVVSAAEGDQLEALVTWVIEHLQLNESPVDAQARRSELIAKGWHGVAQGGLAGLTDPMLNSEYGQVLLQTVLRLRQSGAITGQRLVRAALESGNQMLVDVAADVMAGWPGHERIDH